jgi:nitrogen fixation NifU-like protein
MAMEGNDWVYSETVKDHFLNPRNFLMGDESKFDYDAVGLVGNPICGDQMKMYIKVKDNTIADIRWKTYGCASAIASTSALSEIAKGKTLDEALKITAEDIDDYLGKLPKHKFHCSILGHDALKDVIEKYREKDGNKSVKRKRR